jgi:hypothetical protein
MAALGRCALLSSWERMPGSNVRLRLVRICSAVAIAAIAAACSFTTSLDGFSNGPTDDGGSLGEAANGTDASMVDGDAGSVVTDASIGVEAGGDGGFPFCAAHASAVFCADFERDPINAGWFDTLNANGGTVLAGPGRDGRGIARRHAAGPARATGQAQPSMGPWRSWRVSPSRSPST